MRPGTHPPGSCWDVELLPRAPSLPKWERVCSTRSAAAGDEQSSVPGLPTATRVSRVGASSQHRRGASTVSCLRHVCPAPHLTPTSSHSRTVQICTPSTGCTGSTAPRSPAAHMGGPGGESPTAVSPPVVTAEERGTSTKKTMSHCLPYLTRP